MVQLLVKILPYVIYYFGIGLFFIFVFETIIKALKKREETKEETSKIFPSGIPTDVKKLFLFLWPYMVILIIRVLREKREGNEKEEISKTKSNFQTRLEKFAQEKKTKKKIYTKSNFQTRLEEAAKKKS